MDQFAPVSLGHPQRSLQVSGLRLTEAEYRPEARFGRHAHAHASITVVIDGLLEERFRARTHICGAWDVLVKPAGEIHDDRIGGTGARCLIVEAMDASEWTGMSEVIFGAVQHLARRDVGHLAHLIHREFHMDDVMAPVAVEGRMHTGPVRATPQARVVPNRASSHPPADCRHRARRRLLRSEPLQPRVHTAVRDAAGTVPPARWSRRRVQACVIETSKTDIRPPERLPIVIPTDRRFWLGLGLIALSLGDAPAMQATDPAGWRTDLRFVVQTLIEGHADAFHAIPRERIEALAERIEQDLGGRQRHEIIIDIARLVAGVGDGHTRFPWPWDAPILGFHALPIRLERFSDGYYVVATAPQQKALMGGRVDRVGRMPIANAIDAIAPIISRDNRHGLPVIARQLLTIPEVVETFADYLAGRDPVVDRVLRYASGSNRAVKWRRTRGDETMR